MRKRKADRPRKPRHVRNYVLWLLGRREWSERELRTRLRQRGCGAAEIEDAIAYAKEQGCQSDTRFAGMKARAESRRRGNRRIRLALAQKGIAPEIIEQQLAEREPEATRAIDAVERFRGKPLDQALRTKVWRYLGTRGFGADAIRKAIEHLAEKKPRRAQRQRTPDGVPLRCSIADASPLS